MSVPKSEPILVVGAGAFGLSTVYHLLKAGYKDITVLEKDEEIPSRWSAANDLNKIVRAEYEDPLYQEMTLVCPSCSLKPMSQLSRLLSLSWAILISFQPESN